MSKLIGVRNDNGTILISTCGDDGVETILIGLSVKRAELLAELLTAAIAQAKGDHK